MTFIHYFARLFPAAIVVFALSAQAQIKAPDEDLTSQAAVSSAGISAGPSGISQATPLAKPADTFSTLSRDLGKTGGEPQAATQATDEANRAAARARGPAKAEAPTQFQRFVQEATGKFLPHFGSQLFDAPQNYAPDSGLPVPANYILGPGDEIRLQVWGAVDFNATLVLDRNGQVLVPKVGVVPLAGVAVRDLETVLRASLAKVFTNFSLNANLGRLRSIQIYVVGQAKQPGTYVVSSLSTLVNALFVSGGPSANGSMRHIELQRAGKAVTRFDLYDFIARGDKSKDATLLSGDVIVIRPAGARVAVTGAFDHSAIYELKDSSNSVGDILALSGGAPAMAKTQKVLLERVDPEKTPSRQVVDLALDPAGLKQALRDGDVLTLLPISLAFNNAVTLQGTVAAPLRYRWFEGMRILDLIPERDALITSDYYKRKNLLVQNAESAQNAGSNVASRIRSMADQINWEYAVIERMDRNKLSTELIPFNLGKAVLQRDPKQNLPLLAGDVVTILSQSDLRVPQDRQTRLVRVEGEVAVPGVYQTLPGETLTQLLQRLGGLTPQAYVFGAELSRESVRSRQQENLDILIRKLEAQFQAQAGSVAANYSGERAAQAQLLQQQQQIQMKSQVERLKAFKSNGRLAMELDPHAQGLAALPALPLEDGDRILIPAVPGFVSAFGSVNNENVFIYKPGKTVGDVIKSAGLTEDAEPDQAFVLRADGSIVARRDRRSIFGGDFESLLVMPGDALVVPAQIDRESRYNIVTRAVKDWTQIFSNFGLGVAALKSIRSL
jgi:protein involved in polysaccharide export with SLBB domain